MYTYLPAQELINLSFSIGYFEFISRLATAVLCGFLVGFERKWINRVAGVQTNVLVSAGAAIFVMGSYFVSYEGQSASRIAAQIVSGIGFLGAGVIFREGFNTHGINTAATMWSSAAIGVLSGMGLIPFAFMAAIFLIVANTVFRQMDHIIVKNRKWVDSRIYHKFEIQVLAPKEISKQIRNKSIELINVDDHRIYSVKTNVDNKDFIKLKVLFTTQNQDRKYIETCCSNIEDYINSINDKYNNVPTIVDWSEI